MNDEVIERFYPEPVLSRWYFRVLREVLGYTLNIGPIIIALFVWVGSNWFYGMSALFLLYIIFGIVSSKMRQSYTPTTQREHTYSSFELASWLIAYYWDSEAFNNAFK